MRMAKRRRRFPLDLLEIFGLVVIVLFTAAVYYLTQEEPLHNGGGTQIRTSLSGSGEVRP